jgi:opacity protein-like surface antigen
MKAAARWMALLVACWLLACWPVAAEDVHKRFRLSLAIGGYQAQDEINSDSANLLTILNDEGEITARVIDPRNDAGVAGNFEIQPGSIATLAWQYGFTRFFLLEGSVGYNANDVGDVEINEIYHDPVRFSAGKLTRLPVQLTGLWRFRPDSNFRPYVGAGIGYSFVDFDSSDDLIELSGNLEASSWRQAKVERTDVGGVITVPSVPAAIPMTGATVQAPDAWEWHIVGGAELSVARRWSVLVELRYSQASDSFHLQFDGKDQIGISVPQGQTEDGTELSDGTYGPAFIFPGGLLDFDGDDELDHGSYYVTGGELRYDGIAAVVGVRYTF